MRRMMAGSVVLVILGLALAACGAGTSSPPTTRPPRTSAPSTTGRVGTAGTSTTTSTTGPTATTVPTAPTSVRLTQVVCATTYGVQPSGTPSLPSTVVASVPTGLADRVAAYTDAQGEMRILAPTGWACSATIGADGSSELAAYPVGQHGPRDGGHGTGHR